MQIEENESQFLIKWKKNQKSFWDFFLEIMKCQGIHEISALN